jgi:hypothetical protein
MYIFIKKLKVNQKVKSVKKAKPQLIKFYS